MGSGARTWCTVPGMGIAEEQMARDEEARPGCRESPFSVLQLVRGTNRVLDRVVGTVWVEGEVTALTRASSGHIYFSLSDEGASVRAAMWRSDARRLKFELKQGQRVVCRGRLGVYERDGKMQMYVQTAEPAGLGSEALALAQLKEKLTKEGLFSTERKRELPFLPRRIGVVTSEKGAAVRDIIHAVQRRFPVPILIAHAQVQGDLAPTQIAKAVGKLQETDCDVIIVGRGGGSAGDLAAFNSETVVRAVASSKVPTISAVGHEVDLSLVDLVADKRAATPTMAGEMAVPVRSELRALLTSEERRLGRELRVSMRQAAQELDLVFQRATRSLDGILAGKRKTLAALEKSLGPLHPRAKIDAHRAEVAALHGRLNSAAIASVARRKRVYGESLARLEMLSPLKVLSRGYSITSSEGEVLRSASQVKTGAELDITLAAGKLSCVVREVFEEESANE